jgi:hypothetical protein
MRGKQRLQTLIKVALPTVVALAMVGTFMLVGGPGLLPGSTAHAAPATAIKSISVNNTCDATGGFTGVVTLDGTFTGNIVLKVTYHTPGSSSFLPTGDTTTVTFNGTSSATYAFQTLTQFPGANTYRIEVVDSGGLGGATEKSNSVQPCTPGTTATPTFTPPPKVTPTATPTIGKTTTTTTTT